MKQSLGCATWTARNRRKAQPRGATLARKRGHDEESNIRQGARTGEYEQGIKSTTIYAFTFASVKFIRKLQETN